MYYDHIGDYPQVSIHSKSPTKVSKSINKLERFMKRLEAMHYRLGSPGRRLHQNFGMPTVYTLGVNTLEREGKDTRRNRRGQVGCTATMTSSGPTGSSKTKIACQRCHIF